MSIARGIQGIGETAGHLVQFMATMNGVGAIFQKMGWARPVLASSIGFAAPGAISRWADPEQAEHMTARKWLVHTGAEGIVGAAFPFLGNLGGEVIATKGSNIKALFKLFKQSGVLSGALTAEQFATKWHDIMADNPDKTAMDSLIDAAGSEEFNLENLLYNFAFMSILHGAPQVTRFLPGKKVKTTAIGKPRKTPMTAKETRDYMWNSLSGKQRAEIFHNQIKTAQ